MTEILDRIGQYLENHATMILSTVGEAGPWAAPVFFVTRGLRLYYLSEPITIHSQNIQRNPTVGVVVTEDHWEWRNIQGLQMQGQVWPVDSTWEVTKLVAAYCRKFPNVTGFFDNPGKFKGALKAKWYCFVPSVLKLTDNTTNFGEHVEVHVRVDRKTGETEIIVDSATNRLS